MKETNIYGVFNPRQSGFYFRELPPFVTPLINAKEALKVGCPLAGLLEVEISRKTRAVTNVKMLELTPAMIKHNQELYDDTQELFPERDAP